MRKQTRLLPCLRGFARRQSGREGRPKQNPTPVKTRANSPKKPFTLLSKSPHVGVGSAWEPPFTMRKEGLRRNGRLAGLKLGSRRIYGLLAAQACVALAPRWCADSPHSRDSRTLAPGHARAPCAWKSRTGSMRCRDGDSKRRARERWCAHGERVPARARARPAPRPGAARAWTQDGRARVSRRFALTSLPAPFHGSFFCTVCACSLATLERRASQELASKAAHAHPTPIPWSVFSAPAEPGKSVAPRHRCAASSSCRSRRPARADGA